MEQMAFPDLHLTPVEQLEAEAKERDRAFSARLSNLTDWLINVHGCDRHIKEYAERLCREFGRVEAEDRAKGLVALCGYFDGGDGWTLEDADYIGIYDHSIHDHHIIWDRAWAIRMQVPRELVPKVYDCSYGGKPKFYDRDGNVIFTSVYVVNGQILTPEQRRAALAEMEVMP